MLPNTTFLTLSLSNSINYHVNMWMISADSDQLQWPQETCKICVLYSLSQQFAPRLIAVEENKLSVLPKSELKYPH